MLTVFFGRSAVVTLDSPKLLPEGETDAAELKDDDGEEKYV